jgi:hypothetical protein
MRKLMSLSAVLFMLGVALVSKPAVALPLCDCEYCSTYPNFWCWDYEHTGGFRFTCYEYTFSYCQ